MNIKPYDKTIKDLLISGRQFVIPRFQRAYSWEKRNYNEFFYDIFNSIAIEEEKLTAQPYFLGTMLFVGDYTDGVNREIYVVDGQQRLTTITILFSALSDRFKEENEEGLSKQIFKYIMTTDDDGEEVRILQSKTHYPFFSFFIQERKKNVKDVPTSEEEKCIKETYNFLYDALSEKKLRSNLQNKFGNELVSMLTYIDILKAIRNQILSTVFVSISTSDKKEANKIFEILNGKGKKLADIDLIKNRIFDVLNKTEPADFAEEKWNKIKSVLSTGNECIGFATFFYHFWNSSYSKVTRTSLYEKFKKEIKPVAYESFLNELESSSLFYMQIISPKREDYKNRKEYFWLVQSLNVLSNYFSIVQVRIVLLALFKLHEQDLISSKKFKSAIVSLENFHFVYNALMRNRPNRIESIYSKFSITVQKCTNKQDVHRVLDEQLIKPLQELLPTYKDFEEKFSQLSYSKGKKTSNVITKYTLNKINCYFSKQDVFDDSLSIEHIICEKHGEKYCNIGNLLALEVKLNNMADDVSYNKKIETYEKSSYLFVRDFIQNYPTWAEEQIPERAKKLAKLYYNEILRLC